MSHSKKRPHRYTVEFRRRAAEMVLLEKRSVTQVARQLHCSTQSVNNWIERFRDQTQLTTSPILSYSTTKTSPKSRTTFLPLQVDDNTFIAATQGYEIVTKNGLTLRFPVDTSLETLAEFIRRLEAVPC